MPRGDRSGPWGAGSMTGRGTGYCAGYDAPGYAQGSFGGSFRQRRYWDLGAGVGGRGHRRWFWATGLPRWARWGGFWGAEGYPEAPTAAERAEALKAHAAALRHELATIEQDLAALERKDETQGE